MERPQEKVPYINDLVYPIQNQTIAKNLLIDPDLLATDYEEYNDFLENIGLIWITILFFENLSLKNKKMG